jgi:hypothetical protein
MTALRRSSVTDSPQHRTIGGNLILWRRHERKITAFIIGLIKKKMKAILEYDLNDSDDKMSHLRAVKSLDMAICLWEIRSMKRDNYDTADQVFDRLDEFFSDNNLLMDELIC